MGQAWRQAVRRGARQVVQDQREGNTYFTRLFSPKSYFGRIAQNFGSAQMNFKQGNNLAGAIDSMKVGGDVAKPFVAAAVALATFPKVAKEWGAAMIESKRQLGEFNAAYSVAAGRLDIQRFQRTRQLAAGTSGTFRTLTQAQNRLEDRLAPYAIVASNALMKLATLAINVANGVVVIAETAAVVSGWATIMKAAGDFFGLKPDVNPQNQPLVDLAQALARGNFAQRVRPPMPPLNNAPPPGANRN